MLSRLDFFITETFISLRRHPAMAFAASVCIAAALFVTGVVALTMLNVEFAVDKAIKRVQLNVYFQPELTRQEAWAAYKRIQGLGEVEESTFVPREKSKQWLEWKREHPNAAELLGRNPMPDMAIVKAYRVENMQALRKELASWPEVRPFKQNVGQEVEARLISFNEAIARGGSVVGLILGILSLVIIHHTIELTLYARRREMFIMSLVGATPSTVALPFLLEGMLYGLLGSGAALGLLYGLYRFTRTQLQTHYGLTLYGDVNTLTYGALLILAAGMVLGLIGSTISVLKYIRSPRSRVTNA